MPYTLEDEIEELKSYLIFFPSHAIDVRSTCVFLEVKLPQNRCYSAVL